MMMRGGEGGRQKDGMKDRQTDRGKERDAYREKRQADRRQELQNSNRMAGMLPVSTHLLHFEAKNRSAPQPAGYHPMDDGTTSVKILSLVKSRLANVIIQFPTYLRPIPTRDYR
eukprot:767056-Hanusia_phi.AAC.2